MNYYFEVLKKYAVFKGRASRKEFWMFVLFNVLVSFILSVIGSFAKTSILANLYSLAVFIPSLAVSIRRIHDVGKSGWFILIPIYNLVLYCIAGAKGDNQYGPDPYGAVAAAPVSQPQAPQA